MLVRDVIVSFSLCYAGEEVNHSGSSDTVKSAPGSSSSLWFLWLPWTHSEGRQKSSAIIISDVSSKLLCEFSTCCHIKSLLRSFVEPYFTDSHNFILVGSLVCSRAALNSQYFVTLKSCCASKLIVAVAPAPLGPAGALLPDLWGLGARLSLTGPPADSPTVED